MVKKDIPTLMCVIRDHTLVAVYLRMGRKVIDTLMVPAKGHLDEALIPLLDGFLKHHRIDPRALGKVTIQAGPIDPVRGKPCQGGRSRAGGRASSNGVDRNSSAYRIVHTWAAALKAAQNQYK